MTNFTRRKIHRKIALLNTTALITLDRTSENYFPHFKKFFDKTLTLDFILNEEIVFERRIQEARSKGYLVLHGVNEDDITEAKKLMKNWKKLALADALIIIVGLKLREKGEVFVITDDLIERKAAEENHLNTQWTSTVAVVFHYLGFTFLPKYINDVIEKKILWISNEALRALKLFESKQAIEILLNLHETSNSHKNLVSRYSKNLVDALTETGIILLRKDKYIISKRHDVAKIIPNIKMIASEKAP